MIKTVCRYIFIVALVVAAWKTEDFWNVWQATTYACKTTLDEAGIGIPFPQQDVHLDEEVIKALSK